MSSSVDTLQDVVEQLKRSLLADRLAHAYLVKGAPRGNGRDLAVACLQMLMCESAPDACGTCSACRRITARTHPDTLWVEPQKKSRIISIDQVRDLMQRVYRSSFEGGWKAIIIAGADRMNAAAANALLKTLEEPPPKTLLLLLTDSPEALLPTILSRCQLITLPQSDEEADVWMDQLLSILMTPCEDPILRPAMRASQIQSLLGEIKDDVEEEIVKDLEGAGDELDKETLDARVRSRTREYRMNILKALMLWYRDLLICVCGNDQSLLHYGQFAEYISSEAQGVTEKKALRKIDVIEKMHQQLERNLPEAQVFAQGFRRL